VVKKSSGNGILLKADVSIPDDVKSMVKTFIKKRKKIDILVNNAGLYFRNSFENIIPEMWDKIISVNLTGCFNLCKEVISYMEPK
jgi:NAD(P)-dependent dehydrogenase (short-subunit alcohol dehydrogenase family)